MKLIKKCTIIFSLLLTMMAGEAAYPAGLLCEQVFNLRTYRLSEVPRLRLMTYNLENFFLDTSEGRVKLKDLSKVAGIAKVILDQRPDIIVVAEAQNQRALELFSQRYLSSSYRVLVEPGNDGRGINVGFLVKRSLDVDLEVVSHRDFPSSEESGNAGKPIFSRDLPALIVRDTKESNPALIVFANHGKSKRDRPGDPESNKLRTAQVDAIAEITSGHMARFGKDTPVVVAGDFNTDVQHGRELLSLGRNFIDAFEMSPTPRSDLERVTHTFHPFKGPTQKGELDAFFLNEPLIGSIKSVRVFRYRDELGNPKPIPVSYDARAENPSDHFPVVLDLSTEPMIRKIELENRK